MRAYCGCFARAQVVVLCAHLKWLRLSGCAECCGHAPACAFVGGAWFQFWR
jgi:hypothetical protein